jgi:nucleotide-binding universal stress UspA family protein
VHALGRLDRWHDPDASARSWRTTLCGLVDHTWCARLLRAPGAHRVEVRDGHPVDVLLAAAVRERASLLVVGSRGVGGNPALALGSTSPRVLQEACVPVLVVPERHGKPAGLRLRHLLVGVDGSAASLAALDAAADVAAMLGGSLSVLHVFEHVPSFPGRTTRGSGKRGRRVRERPGVGAARGGPADVLQGSVARTVADRARRPTLVVPAAAGRAHLAATADYRARQPTSA